MVIRNKILDAVVTAFNLKHADDMAVDLVGKCPVTLVISKGNSIDVKFPMEKEAFKQAVSEMQQMIKGCKVAAPQYHSGIVAMRLTNWKRAPEGYECIRKVIRELVAPTLGDAVCPVCGMGGCNTVAVKDGVYIKTHNHCQTEIETQAHERLESGNYFTGLLGALGGSFLVLAVSLLLIVFTNMSLGWLYAFSTFVAMVGYIHFKGPYGALGAWTVGICSFLAFLIFQYGYALVLFSEVGIYMDMSHFGSEFLALSGVVFSFDYIADSWFEIVFFVLGFVITFVSRPLSKSRREQQLHELAALTVPLVGDFQEQ